MRILIISDSHETKNPITKAIENEPTANILIFLGDGEKGFLEVAAVYPEKKFYYVQGNCDFDSNLKNDEVIEIENKKILITHGHKYDVKNGLSKLLKEAKIKNADIVLYGHTHIPSANKTNGLYMMNPGSVSNPNEGLPTYGVIDIIGEQIYMGIKEFIY